MTDFVTQIASITDATNWWTNTVPSTVPTGDRYIAEFASGLYSFGNFNFTGKTVPEVGAIIMRAVAAARPNSPGTVAAGPKSSTSAAVITITDGATLNFGSSLAEGLCINDLQIILTGAGGTVGINSGTVVRGSVMALNGGTGSISCNGTGRTINCIWIINTASGGYLGFTGNGTMDGNTFVTFYDRGILSATGGGNGVWKNNVALNLAASPTVDPWATKPAGFYNAASSNNGTSFATAGNCPGTAMLTNISPSAALNTVTSYAALNARPRVGSVLLGAGVVSTANGGLDWYGEARGASVITMGAVESATGPVDTTAPTPSSATATVTGPTTASGSVSLNEANGTLYRSMTTNASETVSSVKAAGLTSSVSATGVLPVTFSGLAANTTYYAHYVHTDAAGNDSAVANSSSITTPAADTTPPTLSSPTATTTGTNTANGSVSTNEAGGTLYRLASTNATETTSAIKAAALTTTVSATGVQNVSFTGLNAGTTYYAHYVHRDAAGNDSAVANSASFNTTALPTITSDVLKRIDGAGTVAATSALTWVTILNAATGAFVLTKTGLTTNAGGVFRISDASLSLGTLYQVTWLEATGQRGVGWVAAA